MLSKSRECAFNCISALSCLNEAKRRSDIPTEEHRSAGIDVIVFIFGLIMSWGLDTAATKSHLPSRLLVLLLPSRLPPDQNSTFKSYQLQHHVEISKRLLLQLSQRCVHEQDCPRRLWTERSSSDCLQMSFQRWVTFANTRHRLHILRLGLSVRRQVQRKSLQKMSSGFADSSLSPWHSTTDWQRQHPTDFPNQTGICMFASAHLPLSCLHKLDQIPDSRCWTGREG